MVSRTYRGRRKEVYGARRTNPRNRWRSHGGKSGLQIGLDHELWIASILEGLITRGELDNYTHHSLKSSENHDGWDFTVARRGVVKQFDLTASNTAWKNKIERGKENVLLISLQATKEQAEVAVLSLFA